MFRHKPTGLGLEKEHGLGWFENRPFHNNNHMIEKLTSPMWVFFFPIFPIR